MNPVPPSSASFGSARSLDATGSGRIFGTAPPAAAHGFARTLRETAWPLLGTFRVHGVRNAAALFVFYTFEQRLFHIGVLQQVVHELNLIHGVIVVGVHVPVGLSHSIVGIIHDGLRVG